MAFQPARWPLVAAEIGGHDVDVLPRVLADAATASSVIYLVAYLWVIDAQNGAIAWWSVGLMVLAALSFTVAALGTAARAALTVGLVTSALAMLVAVLSLGALLAPTFVAAAIALMATRPGAHTCGAGRTTTESATRGLPGSRSARGTAAGQFLVWLSRNWRITDLNTSP